MIAPYLRGNGPPRFTDAATRRSGEQAALGQDLLDLLDTLEIERAIVGGYDWGGRIPVTRVTPALPDPRWRPKAYEGEVVPFRATVFREGHDQVGAMLVITSPSGAVRHERMSPLAAGTGC